MIYKIKQWLSMALLNHHQVNGFFEPIIQMFLPSYSANKYRAKIQYLRDESREVYSLVLKPQKNWNGFKAGQFVELVIEQDGIQLTRIFSISSSPQLFKSQGIIELSIQKQSNGRVTNWIYESVKVGQYVNISAAKGDFILENNHQPVLIIAAGTGITPFRSILNEYSSIANNTKIHLLYYAKNAKHLFIDELKDIESVSKNITITFLNSTEYGRICLQHLDNYCPDYLDRQFYICGPSLMIQTTEELLLANNVSNQNIHYEYFGPAPVKDHNINTTGLVSFFKSSIQVLANNNHKQTLLEMAESANLKPTTGCRMGLCHQCVCEKKHGVVYNTLTKTYSDTGNEDVQLCISVPVGDVSINL